MVALVMDRDSTFEMGRYYGRSQVTMFARLNGRPVGVLANDPLAAGGAMDAQAAQKFEKFVDLCDSFHLPVVNFVDQPGFMIGPAAEAAGTLKQGVRALAALYQAEIPWASIIVRRVYGVAGAGHQNHERFNLRMAWPSGEWGSLPIEGGVAAAYRRQIEAADDPAAERDHDARTVERSLQELAAQLLDPLQALRLLARRHHARDRRKAGLLDFRTDPLTIQRSDVLVRHNRRRALRARPLQQLRQTIQKVPANQDRIRPIPQRNCNFFKHLPFRMHFLRPLGSAPSCPHPRKTRRFLW